MRSIPPLILLALLLAYAPPAALAQKSLCPKPPPSPYKHSGQIVTRLDRAARRMRTTLEHPRALAGAKGNFYLGAAFLHADPRRGETPQVELVIHGASAAGGLGAGDDLSFLADGRALTPARRASFRSRPAGAAVSESATVSLSLPEVTRLTGARRVSVRVGASELVLTHNHLEALRELVSQMAPAPSRWSEATAEALSAR
jgi:hypothetical protein